MDNLFDEVLSIIKNRKKISCKALIKKFDIGYARAAKILDEMEKKGIISEVKPARARKVLTKGYINDTKKLERVEKEMLNSLNKTMVEKYGNKPKIRR